ncbi:MAG: hypothetical protein JWM91_1199 [Rhodospirillales bacterium]|nr:hypothetical protein [Rhodospirillales bacterium]
MSPGNAPPTAIEADRKLQMKLMDLLPADLKQVVWLAPVPLDVRQVKTMHNDYKAGAAERLKAAILREYPGWRMA